jgi:hypothetical protein
MRHSDIDAHQLGNRAHQASRLPKRLLEYHAQRQTHFNRQIRIHRLTTRCRAPWSRSHRKCILADPNGQITTPPQAFVIFGAVGHAVLLLWNLVTTISVELVRHLQHPQEVRPQPISVERGSMQQRPRWLWGGWKSKLTVIFPPLIAPVWNALLRGLWMGWDDVGIVP